MLARILSPIVPKGSLILRDNFEKKKKGKYGVDLITTSGMVHFLQVYNRWSNEMLPRDMKKVKPRLWVLNFG